MLQIIKTFPINRKYCISNKQIPTCFCSLTRMQFRNNNRDSMLFSSRNRNAQAFIIFQMEMNATSVSDAPFVKIDGRRGFGILKNIWKMKSLILGTSFIFFRLETLFTSSTLEYPGKYKNNATNYRQALITVLCLLR